MCCSSLQKAQTGCAKEFQYQTTPFKRLITGKKQPGGLGRTKEKSERTLEEVEELEQGTPAKQRKITTRSSHGRGKGRGKGGKNK